MDGLRKIASAYYGKAALEERMKVMELFDNLDLNGDGRISSEEYKKCVPGWYSDNSLFRRLDANGNGKLDFSDVVVLYYMGNKSDIHKCDVCGCFLVGLYFTCVTCYRNGNGTFDLCSDCYAAHGELQHPHSLSNFADQNALLRSIRLQKREMEELSEIAQGCFQAAPVRVQAQAKETFASMDKDGDKRIDLQEFRSFMRGRGCPDKFIPRLFKVLDRDDNGTLDFSEALTLYYIMESGRPFCDMCDEFIPGTFFSCVDCYNRRESPTYDLCRNCYRSGKCKHNHNGQAQFWDNYTLLLNVKRNMAQRPTTQSPATKAITVPAVSSKKEKDSWMEDLDVDAVNMGINIAITAAAMCSIQ